MTMAGGWLSPGSTAPVIMEGFMWSGPGMAPVAPIGARVVTLCDFPVPAPLEVTLTDDQLIAFECARLDGDVELTLDLSVTVLAAPGGMEPTVTSQTRYRIPSEQWLKQLDNVGAAVGITIRVPSPLTDASNPQRSESAEAPSMSRAAKRLREARAALRDGNFEGCITSCRFVLENIALLEKPLPVEEVRHAVPKLRTQQQRWSAMFHDLYSLASGASHDDELTATFEWTRADAEAILAATAGLLARLRGL